MIRLSVSHPSKAEQTYTFNAGAVTFGRAPDNMVCLEESCISKHHGVLSLAGKRYTYEDLGSTNGSTIVQDDNQVSLDGGTPQTQALDQHGVIGIGSYSIRIITDEPLLASDQKDSDITVVLTRPILDIAEFQAKIVTQDAEVSNLFLRLVRETGAVLHDEQRLTGVITEIVFQAFPRATHLVLAVQDTHDGHLQPLLVQSRHGDIPEVALSRTIVNRVLDEGLSLLFSQAQSNLSSIESVTTTSIETAICAPLRGAEQAFGVMQLDIRKPSEGVFSNSDLDRLTLYACHVGLVLDNLRLYQEQHRALQSTIQALVHSLSLKDPETAYHSERVQAIATLIGREMNLSGEQLEVLGVAAILHDMGKHATPDEILLKPTRLTTQEMHEIAQHSSYSQAILDKIHYPDRLKEVPRIAALHHERLDGSGTYGICGEEIPLLTRIITVADVFDALASQRAYKEQKPLFAVLGIMAQGRDQHWDGQILDVVEQLGDRIAREVYGEDSFLAQGSKPVDEDQTGVA
jgi:HD-GYP domain-containing protein (c-di-GMP phosphodiesterase class II)